MSDSDNEIRFVNYRSLGNSSPTNVIQYVEHPNLTATNIGNKISVNLINPSNGSLLTDPNLKPPAGPPLYLQTILLWLQTYYLMPLIAIGMVLNIGMACTLLGTSLRRSSACQYLSASSVVNVLYLLSLLLTTLTHFGIDLYNTPGWCQLLTFMSSVSDFLSLWLVVALGVDRLFIHCWPAHAKQLCNTFRARIVILGLVVLAVVVFMNISLTRGVIFLAPNVPQCIPLNMFLSALTILDVFNGIINIILPYTTLLIIDAVLWKYFVVTLHHRVTNRAAKNVMATSETIQTITVKNKRMSGLMAPYFVFFVFLRTPNEIFKLIYAFKSVTGDMGRPDFMDHFWQTIFQNIYYLTFAIQPVVLCLFHKTLRKHALSVFCSICRKSKQFLRNHSTNNLDIKDNATQPMNDIEDV